MFVIISLRHSLSAIEVKTTDERELIGSVGQLFLLTAREVR